MTTTNGRMKTILEVFNFHVIADVFDRFGQKSELFGICRILHPAARLLPGVRNWDTVDRIKIFILNATIKHLIGMATFGLKQFGLNFLFNW